MTKCNKGHNLKHLTGKHKFAVQLREIIHPNTGIGYPLDIQEEKLLKNINTASKIVIQEDKQLFKELAKENYSQTHCCCSDYNPKCEYCKSKELKIISISPNPLQETKLDNSSTKTSSNSSPDKTQEYNKRGLKNTCLNCGKLSCNLSGIGNIARINENNGCWIPQEDIKLINQWQEIIPTANDNDPEYSFNLFKGLIKLQIEDEIKFIEENLNISQFRAGSIAYENVLKRLEHLRSLKNG